MILVNMCHIKSKTRPLNQQLMIFSRGDYLLSMWYITGAGQDYAVFPSDNGSELQRHAEQCKEVRGLHAAHGFDSGAANFRADRRIRYFEQIDHIDIGGFFLLGSGLALAEEVMDAESSHAEADTVPSLFVVIGAGHIPGIRAALHGNQRQIQPHPEALILIQQTEASTPAHAILV